MNLSFIKGCYQNMRALADKRREKIMQIDVTYSVTLENTSKEVEQFLYQSLEKYGLPVDLWRRCWKRPCTGFLAERGICIQMPCMKVPWQRKKNKTEGPEATGVKHTGTKEELVGSV